MPKLQIHIPAYNEEKNIGYVIRDVLDQEYKDISLVIHDNKSTDNTIAECIKAIGGDPRAKVNKAPLNIGALYGGLRARCHYDAEYVCYRSANDRIHKNFIPECIDLLLSDLNIGLAYSHGYIYENNINNSTPCDDVFKIETRGMDPVLSSLEVVSRYTYSFPLWGIYRRNLLESLRPYQFVHGGDHILLAEAALYGSVAATSSRLEYKSIPTSDVDGQRTKNNAKSQLEEHQRNINEESFLYGVKHLNPFTDMAYGHIEMYSLARIPENNKLHLMNSSVSILKKRFDTIIYLEARNFTQYVINNVNKLETFPKFYDLRILIWIQKVKTELYKIKVLESLDFNLINSLEIALNTLTLKFKNLL
jgi:glycosyltransferase involved in cell wall biosynthesis